MRLTSLGKYLPHLGWPLLLGLAGLALFYVLGRMDAAQTARLNELDHQQAQAVQQTLDAAKTWKATAKASKAAKAEIARRRAAEAVLATQNARLRKLADSLTRTIQPLLAGLPDSVATPIRLALAAKDSVIGVQDRRISNLLVTEDSLTREAGRWETEAGNQRALALTWQARSKDWEKEARRGCLPLIGCVSRTVTFLVGAGVGGAAVVALRP